MKWYAAHVIMYFEPMVPAPGWDDQPEEDREYVVWENVLLFLGNSADEALEKARDRGKADERDGGDDLTWGECRVRMVFGGVKKVVECDFSEREGTLSEGDEITYSEMKIKGNGRLNRMIHGDDVEVVLE